MNKKESSAGQFVMLGTGMTRHVKQTARRDRRRPSPAVIDDTPPPAQIRLENLTRSGLAQLGRQFYTEVLQVHDPIVAKATSALEQAERLLDQAKAKEVEAEAACTAPAIGAANDQSRTPHRKFNAARAHRERAEAGVAAADSALAEVKMARGAAIDAAKEKGFQHLSIGEAVVRQYQETWAQYRLKQALGTGWSRLFGSSARSHAPDISTAPSGLGPAEWMSEDHDFAGRAGDETP